MNKSISNTDTTEASPVLDPEWSDNPGVRQLFGMRRGLLYKLEASGCINGVSLRQPGKKKGKRLWSVPSIRAYIASQMVGNGKR